MFFIADRKKDYPDRLTLIANYLFELSGRNENCVTNTHPHMWFTDVIIKCSDMIKVSCKAPVIKPWDKESCLIPDIKESPVWVHFDFNMMNFSLGSFDEMNDIYANAARYFDGHK